MPLDFAQQMEEFGFIPFNHQMPKEDFDPYLGNIYDHKGNAIPGYQAVMRSDTGDTLAVHSDKYALVPYKRHFRAFEMALEESRLDLTGMRVGTDYADNGAKIFRQYLLPAHTKVINNRGHERPIALRFYMFDSYDGSTAWQGASGFFDFVCANSSIFGDQIDRLRFRHVGDMEAKVSEAAQVLTEAAERFILNHGRMTEWPRTPLSNVQFSELVSQLPQSNQRLVDELTARFARMDGDNLWDAHQMLTDWSTHGIPAKTQADRQKRVAALVAGQAWTDLEPEMF